MFYATAPGDPALEVEITEADVTSRQSLYTKLLLEGLHGKVPQIIRTQGRNDIVMAYELSQYLKTGLPDALAAANILRNQRPDAEITSREPLHLSKFPRKPTKPVRVVRPLKGKRSEVMNFETVKKMVDHPLKGAYRDTISFSQRPTGEELEYIERFREASAVETDKFHTGFIVFGAQLFIREYDLPNQKGPYVHMVNLDHANHYQNTYFMTLTNGTIYP